MGQKWRKVESGKYQAEGTTIQVVKSTTSKESWHVLDTATGLVAWHSPTMREAKDMAAGSIAEQAAGATAASAADALKAINEDMMQRGRWSASTELIETARKFGVSLPDCEGRIYSGEGAAA